MPTDAIIVSVAVVAAFSIFAITLAYGEYQTRNFKRPSDAVPSEEKPKQTWLKAA